MDHDMLDAMRQEAARAEFEGFAFDPGFEPEEADGWEREGAGDEWTRTVYFPGDADGGEADGETVSTLKGSFTVTFASGSAEVTAAWASLGGQDVGSRPSVEPKP